MFVEIRRVLMTTQQKEITRTSLHISAYLSFDHAEWFIITDRAMSGLSSGTNCVVWTQWSQSHGSLHLSGIVTVSMKGKAWVECLKLSWICFALSCKSVDEFLPRPDLSMPARKVRYLIGSYTVRLFVCLLIRFFLRSFTHEFIHATSLGQVVCVINDRKQRCEDAEWLSMLWKTNALIRSFLCKIIYNSVCCGKLIR